jgi:cytochrome c biogenesis protein CcmG/thiol:disulfide interchange protein DsbE
VSAENKLALLRLRLSAWQALALVLLLVGGVAYTELRTPQAAVGRPAPDFKLAALDGRQVRLADYRGRVVFLNFWAGWCGSCREETPALQAFVDRYGDRVVLLGINYREAKEEIEAFRREFDLTYPLLQDTDGRVADIYKMKALPESWVVDAAGVARTYWIGPLTFEDMRAVYYSTTGESLDGERLPGDAHTSYRFSTRGGLYLIDGERAWRSRDGGLTWETAAQPSLPGLSETARDEAWAGRQALAWVEGQGLHYSADGGAGWRRVQLAPFAPDTAHVAVALSDKKMWVGAADALFSSADAGATWRREPFALPVLGLAAAEDGVRLYIATPRGVWEQDDSGYRLLAGSPSRRFDDVAVVRLAQGEAIVAVAPNGDVYHVDADGGWRLVNDAESVEL